jgi:hypothetical protein
MSTRATQAVPGMEIRYKHALSLLYFVYPFLLQVTTKQDPAEASANINLLDQLALNY